MKFNSFKQLSEPEARELREHILSAFYARHPEVQKAVNYDSLAFGSLTEKTKGIVRQALDRDAGMQRALQNIACDPYRRGNPQVSHNEWEEFSKQLVGYAREALGQESLAEENETTNERVGDNAQFGVGA